MLRTTATADSSQASFPQPLKAPSGSATSGNTASFWAEGTQLPPAPVPSRPHPQEGPGQGVPATPPRPAHTPSPAARHLPGGRKGRGLCWQGKGHCLRGGGGCRQPGHSLSAKESLHGSVRSALQQGQEQMLCLEPRVQHFGVQMVTAPCSQPLPAECTPCAPPPFTSCILQARDIPSGHPNEPYSSPVALQSRLKAPPVRNVPLELLPDRLTQQS